jgi:competence protein ComEA
MKTQQETGGASRRANAGHATRTTELGGRFTASGLGVWAPVIGKLVLALAAAIVLAIIGARAGATAVEPAAGPTVLVSPDQGLSAEPSNARAMADAGLPNSSPREPPATLENGGGTLPDGRVVLNRASEEDLTKLPGIGPSRAKAILALRARIGRFRAPQDLLRVKGIGRKTLARLLPMVVVNPPEAPRDAGA